MNPRFQLAAEKDLPCLIELMRELYQHEGMTFHEDTARSGLNKTLVDPTLGLVSHYRREQSKKTSHS